MKYIITLLTILIIAVLSFFIFKYNKPKPIIKEKEVVKEEPIKQAPEEKEVIEVEEVKIIPEKIDQTEAWKEIESKIESGNPYKKQEAIETLVSIGDEKSIKTIEQLTEDKTPSVVNRALLALGELKSEESIPLIDKVFEANRIRQDGYGESIRINAVDALGNIGSEKSIDMLGAELSKKNASFGSHVIGAMEKIGSNKALPYLEEYKTFLDEQLSNLPGAEEIGEYRYVWEQFAKQVNEAIDKIKEKS